MCNCAMPRAYITCAHMCTCHCTTAACVFVYSIEETGSKFDLLFEVIYKDLAVPAVSVKLTLGSWFVLAVAMFY